jgi:photosystem II stability/assembly factor-like uncharacterized protein
VFKSATAGWFAVACPAVTVLTTGDGGATWTVKPLPACSCHLYVPEYIDAQHAVITSTQSSSVLMTTADGGATWIPHPAPSAAITQYSFVDPNNGWMVGIEQLPQSYDTVVYRTTDGGQSWQLLGKPGFATSVSNPNAYSYIDGAQFIDANTGFVQVGQQIATRQGAVDAAAPDMQILSTSDAGRTWSAVYKHVPPAVCSSSGSSYGQLSNSPGMLWPVKMATPTVGWAKGGLRTTDGGVHWRDVSTPALREGAATPLYPRGYADAYLDGDHAWQAGIYGSKSSCGDHVTVFATGDGGKTWQQSNPIVLSLPAMAQVGSTQMGFTDSQAGWLWVPIGSQSSNDPFSSPPTDARLYTTSDGGSTWRLASTLGPAQLRGVPPMSNNPNCVLSFGQVTFASAMVGWLSVNCSNSFLVTRDGGATWKVENLPIPTSPSCPCYVTMPNFLDANHGVAVVSNPGGPDPATVLLETTDGGSTWRRAARPGSGFLLLLDYVNVDDLFALVTPPGWTKISKGGMELYRSVDGGGSWTLVKSDVPATWPPGFMQFVDLNHGFESNVNGASELLTTVDGGASWKSITPAIVSGT